MLEQHQHEFQHVLLLIQEARERVYAKANSELVLLYFNVGKYVAERLNDGKWGDNTVQELADFIHSKVPNLSGFNRRGLYRMKQFYETHCAEAPTFKLWAEVVSPSATQSKTIDSQTKTKVSPMATQIKKHAEYIQNTLLKLSWSHHLEVFSAIKKPEETLYYILQSINEKWSKTELRRQIKTASYERTLLAKASDKKPISLITQLPQNFFKDPYVFEFLDLPEIHSEKDLESALIQNLQQFILEIGKGFTYMGRQFRLQIGNKDYRTDLLFYHRDLQCLVLFELKIQDFEPEFLGKINFYLEALDRDVKRPHENPSIGILLCKGKDTEVVEYALARNTSPALIAEYETKLIDKKILAAKLHQLTEALNKDI